MLFSTLITPIEVNSRGTLIQHFKLFMLSPLLTLSKSLSLQCTMDPSQENSFFESKIKDRFGFGLKKSNVN